MNYWMCEYRARQKGFQCADNFAQYMGADYDRNGDGQIDSDALRYVAGETEAAYVTRITSTLRSTIRDANTHFVSVEQQLRLHPVGQHAPDLHRRHRHAPACSAARTGSGAARYTSFDGRQEPDLEPVRPRAHGLGAVDLQPGDALTARQAIAMDGPRHPGPKPTDRSTESGRGARPGLPRDRAGHRRGRPVSGLMSSPPPAPDRQRHGERAQRPPSGASPPHGPARRARRRRAAARRSERRSRRLAAASRDRCGPAPDCRACAIRTAI